MPLYFPPGSGSNSVVVTPTGGNTSSASANFALINAALANGGNVALAPNLGAVYISRTLIVPSYTTFTISTGTYLTRLPGVAPFQLIRNKSSQDFIYLGTSTASGGFITFYQPGHSWNVGDTVFLENVLGWSPTAQPVTVTASTAGVSWTCAASSTPTNITTPGAQQIIYASKYNPMVAANFARTITSATVTFTVNPSTTVTFSNSSQIITGLGSSNGYQSNMPVAFFPGSGTLPTGLNPYPQIYFYSLAAQGATSGAVSLWPTGSGQNYAAVSQYYTTNTPNLSSGTLTAVQMPIKAGCPMGSGGTVNWTNHGMGPNQPVQFHGGTLPTNLSADTTYWTVAGTISPNSFQVSATRGGMPVPFYGTPSGTTTGYQGVVTVTETGHSREAGDIVYINGLATDTTFNGIYQILSVIPGTSWQYVSAGQSTSCTGTANVLGDRGITIDIGGIDGSVKGPSDIVYQANLGTTYNQTSTALTQWTNVSHLNMTIRDSRNSWLGRVVNLAQAVSIEIPYIFGGQNTHVTLQVDACTDRLHVIKAEAFGGYDDIVAWGISTNPVGATPYAGDTAFACTTVFNNASMGSCKVDLINGLSPTSALKVFCGTLSSSQATTNVANFTTGELEVGTITTPDVLAAQYATGYTGRIVGGSIILGDPTSASVAGGQWGSVKISEYNNKSGNGLTTSNAWSFMGPIEIGKFIDSCINLTASNSSEAIFLDGAWSSLTVSHFITNAGRTASAACKFAPSTTTRPAIKFGRIDSGYGGAGQTAQVLLARGDLTGCYNSVDNLTVDDWVHNGNSSTSNILIYSDVRCDFANINITNWSATGCAALYEAQSYPSSGQQYLGYTRNINIANLTVGFPVSCGIGFGGSYGGTWNVAIANCAYQTGNNLFQFYANSSTYQQVVRLVVKNLATTGGLVLSPANSTYQSVSITGDSTAQVDLQNTALTPLVGDTVWNTNAAFGAGIGFYGRTNAGAWAKVF